MAGGAGLAGGGNAACAGYRSDPSSRCGSPGPVSRSNRAARDQRFVISRDRGRHRGACRYRDVAISARTVHAAASMDCRGRNANMTCAETETLLHALLDGELDAGHARDVEGHLADCPRCAAQLDAYRALHQAMSAPQLRYAAPVSLRRSIEAMLPPVPAAPRRATNRRAVLKGFVMGTALST